MVKIRIPKLFDILLCIMKFLANEVLHPRIEVVGDCPYCCSMKIIKVL
jgi:hypothetical protein